MCLSSLVDSSSSHQILNHLYQKDDRLHSEKHTGETYRTMGME